ncbi:MAG: fibronectin type III domain-containing protein [Parcubacteria group bacterium]|nr:fibronectin type III domain-containing protein [Parcubacteria group bacterium]
MSGSGPEYIARFDPATGQTTKLGIIPSGGEAYSMIAAYGKLFIASYPHAILHIYDPTKPFNPSPRLTKTDNPAYYGSTAPNQDRPRAMVKGNDGRIYMANHPTYGYLGGAISWYDPVNDSVGSVPTPVPNQSLWSLASLPDGTIAIGTDIDGGPGTVPTATQTKLCVWNYNDPTRCQWEGAPLQPGNTGIKSLALGGDNLLYGAGGKQVFAFNPATRTILATTTFPQGGVLHRAGLMTLADGRVVALTASSATFVKYNSSTTGGTWTFKTFAKGTLTSGGAILGDYLYAASGKALVRVRIPSATATTVANFEKVGSVIGLGIVQGGSMVAPGPGGQADSQVEYGLTTAYGLSTPIAPTLVSAHSISLTNLTLDTLYHYRVKSRDASGNLATSEDATFRTAQLSTIDTTPPQISNVNASASVSSITVTWQTNEQTDSKVEYGTSATYGSAVSTTTLWTSHSLVLPNLSPDTLYHYRVKSKDASGNESQSSNNTIRTVSDTPGSCTPSSINNGTVSPYPSCSPATLDTEWKAVSVWLLAPAVAAVAAAEAVAVAVAAALVVEVV